MPTLSPSPKCVHINNGVSLCSRILIRQKKLENLKPIQHSQRLRRLFYIRRPKAKIPGAHQSLNLLRLGAETNRKHKGTRFMGPLKLFPFINIKRQIPFLALENPKSVSRVVSFFFPVQIRDVQPSHRRVQMGILSG